jgi:hypothetical protein
VIQANQSKQHPTGYKTAAATNNGDGHQETKNIKTGTSIHSFAN